MKSITEEEFQELESPQQKGYTKEWACKCTECNRKWHYLDSVEKKLQSQILANSLQTVGAACTCNPCLSSATSNASTHLNKELESLKSCPDCGSQNVYKQARFFKNKK